MSAVLDLAVAALAMVLVVSGVLKLRDPEATTPMLRALRLPASSGAAVGVGVVEIVVGAATLVVGGRLTTLALTALYAAFAVVGVVLIRSGAAVPCGCFGQRSTAMTPLHVGVDAVAAAVGAVAVATGAPGLYPAGGDRALGALAVATLAAAALAAAVVALLTVVPDRLAAGAAPRAFGTADARADAAAGDAPAPPPTAGGRPPGPGAAALPVIEGLSLDGDPDRLDVRGSGRMVLLAFLTSGCTTCARFWPVFADLPADGLPGDRTDLVIVVRGDDLEDPARLRALAPPQHRLIRSSAAWHDYGVEAGPWFVLLDGARDRSLGDGAAARWADVEALVRRAVGAGRGSGVAE